MKVMPLTAPASCEPEVASVRAKNRHTLTVIAGHSDRAEPGGVEEANDEPIGALIRRLRLAAGKSQYALARRLVEISANTAITRDEVKRWESQRRIPRPYWREQLSEALCIPREVLDRAAFVAEAQRDVIRRDQAAPVSSFRCWAHGVGGE